MKIHNEEYLRLQLEWLEQRMLALDKIEKRLKEMRELAEYARDNDIGAAEARKINNKLHLMQEEVTKLDKRTKVFWMDYN